MDRLSPSYVKMLLTPTAKVQNGKKVWSIDLNTVWIPFFRSTNVMGESAIPQDTLGLPLRLVKDKDGSVRFSRKGLPVYRVAKELSTQITLVRQNFTAGLIQHIEAIKADMPDDWKNQLEAERLASVPVVKAESQELDKALELRITMQIAEAERAAAAAAEAADAEAERELVTA